MKLHHFSKLALLAVLLGVLTAAAVPAAQGDEAIVLRTNQTEYYFPVGSEASVTITIENPYGERITGQFSYTLSQEQKNGGMNVQSSNSESQQLAIEKTPQPMVFMISAQPNPGVFTLKDTRFEYQDPLGQGIVVTLGTITIHIVEGQQQGGEGQEGKEGQESESQTTEEEQKEQQQMREQTEKEREEQIKKEMQQQLESQKVQNRIQNSQQNQDTGALRDQIEKELKEQQNGEEAMMDALRNSPELREMVEGLLNEGYNLTQEEMVPDGNGSGEFRFGFGDPEGNKATIDGRVEERAVADLSVSKERSLESLMEDISADERFKKYHASLGSEGFLQKEPGLSPDGENRTKVVIPYLDQANKSARIEVLIMGDAINEIDLEKERSLWWLAIVPIVAALFLMVKALGRKEAEGELGISLRDHQAEALELLRRAEKKFREGKGKEGALLVSEGVRLMLESRHGISHDLTDGQAIKQLRGKEAGKEAESCLGLCGMVEFAKYAPSEEDIHEILRLAKMIVGKKNSQKTEGQIF